MKAVHGIGKIQSLEWGVPEWVLLSQGPVDLQIQSAEMCAKQRLC